MSTVLGLNLLHLLVDNKLSEFHCEVCVVHFDFVIFLIHIFNYNFS